MSNCFYVQPWLPPLADGKTCTVIQDSIIWKVGEKKGESLHASNFNHVSNA